MPAIGNIVINDAETTPVAHTFSPVTTDGALAKLANRAAGVPVGYETMSIELRPPAQANAAYRLLIKGNDPTTAVVDGTDAVVRNNSVDFAVNFAQSSTAQERKNWLKMMSNLLAHATIVTVVENLEPIY